jgi:Holliday junction resolvasome RuvABC endonuclease subunit
LSIDPTSRGFGFAVLEGIDRLIDWGVVHAATDTVPRSLDRISKLIERYDPRTLVIEYVSDRSRRGPRARQLLSAAERLALKARVKVRRISQARVRKFFSSSTRTTKHRIAQTVASRFPELAPHLPRPRKPWQSESEMMAVFDAFAFVLALFESR